MTIRSRILIATVAPIVAGIAVLVVVTALSVREQTHERIETARDRYEAAVVDRLRAQVEQAAAAIAGAEAAGADAGEELERVRHLAHGDSYVWIHSLDRRAPDRATMVMHPIATELEGRDMSQMRDLERVERIHHEGTVHDLSDPEVADVEETNLFVDANRAVLESPTHDAVLRYYWPKPGAAEGTGYPKLSYVLHLPEHGWVLGTGEYADFIDEEVAAISDATWARGRRLVGSVVLVGAVIAVTLVGIAIWLAGRIATPLRNTTERLHEISEGDGDLTVRLDETGDGEIAEMSRYFNRFVEKIRSIVHDVGESTVQVSAASTEMAQTSTAMTEAAERTSQHAVSASSASEQISSNIASVATAVEEMDASIREIASQSSSAATDAGQAVERVDHASATVQNLSQSSDRIGSVIQMISGITEQTNLLALNATIEAARAGEAGRGFAVVATEVKNLAKSTAEATEEITDRITGLQGEIHAASEAMGAITDVIRRISDAQSTIAGAVEEQSATVAEISGNVNQVSLGGNEISESISTVASVASETSAGSAQLRAASDELSRMAESLTALVVQFRV